jgi:hypothetical protein
VAAIIYPLGSRGAGNDEDDEGGGEGGGADDDDENETVARPLHPAHILNPFIYCLEPLFFPTDAISIGTHAAAHSSRRGDKEQAAEKAASESSEWGFVTARP